MKKRNQEVEEFYNKIIASLEKLIEKVSPNILEYQRIIAPRLKREQELISRNQIINFIIMFLIISSISMLTYLKLIDSSAATGLLGAIVGYVFGSLYQSSNK